MADRARLTISSLLAKPFLHQCEHCPLLPACYTLLAARERRTRLRRLMALEIEQEPDFLRLYKLAGLSLVCPGEHSSGNKRVPGSVTKHGNPRLRSSLVELAWRLVRFQPQYPPVQKRLPILSKGAPATGAARKKAISRPTTLSASPLRRLGRRPTPRRRSLAAAPRPMHRRRPRV